LGEVNPVFELSRLTSQAVKVITNNRVKLSGLEVRDHALIFWAAHFTLGGRDRVGVGIYYFPALL
jgi:hypothetical protein